MRQKIKFFLSFLTIGLFFIVSSCSEDYEITEHNHTHDGYTIKNYSYKQASKLSKFQKASKIVKQELDLKFSNLKTFKNSKFKKSVARDTDLSFAIDSSLIKEVTKDDVTTYTMLVALDTVDYSDNSFDNLIVKVDSQNNISSYIIHCTPTGEAVYNAIHNSYTFQGDTELSKVYGITTLGGSGSGSGNENGGGSVDYGGSEAGGGANTWDSVICVTLIKCNYLYTHIAGPGCANTYSETICYTNPNYNPWNDGGSSPEEEDPLEGDNSNPGGGGGSTSSSNPTNDTGGTSTVTVLPEEIVALDTDLIKTPAQIEREKDFKAGLSLQQKIWLSNHDDVEDDIFEYLESQVTGPLEEEYSDESVDFIKEALEILNEDGELDLNNEIILEQSFLSNQKAYCVFSKLLTLSNDSHFKKIIVDLFDSNDKANVIFSVANLPTGYDAVTSPNVRGGVTAQSLYKITLDQDFVNNASTIEIALTLVHELIHAELLERCLRLGIITNMGFNSSTYDGIFVFNNGQQISPMSNYGLTFLNMLIQEYRNYSNPSEWNHNLMTGLNYNNIITQNLLEIYPLLNDTSSDFINNINSDINNTNGLFTLNDAFYFLSWRGLEQTQNYINLIQNNPVSLNKKNYIETASNNKFTNTCN